MGSRSRLRIPAALSLWVLLLTTLGGSGLGLPCAHHGQAAQTDSAHQHADTAHHHEHPQDPSQHDHDAPSSCEGFCQIVCRWAGSSPSALFAPSPRGTTHGPTLHDVAARVPLDGENPLPHWAIRPHALPLAQAPPEDPIVR